MTKLGGMTSQMMLNRRSTRGWPTVLSWSAIVRFGYGKEIETVKRVSFIKNDITFRNILEKG